jgi:hypothetical protein
MNPSDGIDTDVLLVAVRIQAALKAIPSIDGPKEAWAYWMRDNLNAEMVRNIIICAIKYIILSFTGQNSRSH